MKYVGMLVRDFFLRNCIIYYVFVYICKKFTNHALSEMILLRGELWRITFDVGSRVQEYMCTSPIPPPPHR